MCPPDIGVKEEEVEGVLPGDATPRGAKAKHEGPKLLAPSKSIPRKLPLKVEDDGDDVLNSLCALFDGMWPGDADDDSDSESDCSEPESPRSRGFEILPRTYFDHGPNRYSFDQEHNVYLEVANSMPRLIHQGRAFSSLDDHVLDLEFIGDFPLYFGMDDTLWCVDQNSTYQVPTWTYPVLDQIIESSLAASPDFFQPNLATGSEFCFQDFSQFPVSNGGFCDNGSAVNPYPLESSLQGQVALPWSPSSSTLSPIVTSKSRDSSSEPLEPLITSWKEETKVIQGERNYVPASKLDRRRCRHCNKIFRRPSSLEDHMNVHTGAKPHICPYERCNTGFATKSNMKRHFVTHRVGKLEDYRRGKGPAGNPLTATYNAKAFHTQRFRLVPS